MHSIETFKTLNKDRSVNSAKPITLSGKKLEQFKSRFGLKKNSSASKSTGK